MTTAAPTETAQGGVAQHGAKAHSDGGWGLVPVQTRSERFRSTDVSAFPAVTGREAEWRYTPVARLAALLDGALSPAEPVVEFDAAEGYVVERIAREDALIGSAGTPEDRASANAWGAFQQALKVTVAGEAPGALTLRRSGFGSEPAAAHTVVEAVAGSRGLVIIDSSGPARLAENVEILVREGARLTVVSVQEWDDDAVHLSSHFARVENGAELKHVVVTLGGDIVRLNPAVHLAEEGAAVDALGVYFADSGQHLEQQVYVFHDAPHSRSRVTYKGALQGASARTVWIGDVLIGRRATGTDSYEQNRNLVLTEGARADSVPNLEIETGDIVGAGHASATGRFDDEQLFYLMARGIPEDEARRLVVRGFLAEIVQQIGEPEIEQRLTAAIEAELAGTAAAAAAARPTTETGV